MIDSLEGTQHNKWKEISAEVEKASNRIKEVVFKTAFEKNAYLSDRFKANIYLKREDQQVVRSFKIRGAYNKMSQLSLEERKRGVVCSSAGNHAQGFALACQKLGISGIIYMPTPTPTQKINKVKKFGQEFIEVRLVGDTYDDAYAKAHEECIMRNAVFIHPFNDYDVIAGQGTVAVEMLAEQKNLDYVLIAVGGGGLLSGVSSYFKTNSPQTKIIAVEAKGAPSFHTSLKKGHATSLSSIDTFADGIAVKQMGDLCFELCRDAVSDSLLVSEGKICSTILDLYNEEAIVVEPAGAVSVAALEQLDDIEGKKIGVVICGGNNDINRTQEIKERALLFEGKKHYFLIRFPQRAGALREFLESLGPNDDITHFEYTKKTNRTSGPALVGLELNDAKDFDDLIKRFAQNGINHQHLNNNPMLFEMLV